MLRDCGYQRKVCLWKLELTRRRSVLQRQVQAQVLTAGRLSRLREVGWQVRAAGEEASTKPVDAGAPIKPSAFGGWDFQRHGTPLQ